MVCGSSPSDGLELLVSRADSCLGGLRWGRMTRVTLERSRSKWLAPIVGHHRRGTSENNDDDAGDEDYDYEDDDDDDDDDDGPSTIARRLRIQAQTNHTVFSEYQQF